MKSRMRTFIKNFVQILMGYSIAILISACAGENYFDQLTVQSSNLSGSIIVAGGATALTAPGTVALFDRTGAFVRQLKDHYADTEITSGLAVFGNTIFTLVDGSDRVDAVNASTGISSSWLSNPQVAGIFRHMAVDSQGYLYVVESNTGTSNRGVIEKVDLNGQRAGTPFINTDTGTTPACALQNPFGITFIPTLNQIVVTNFNTGRLLIYNATTGACVNSVNNAAFTSGNPAGVVYHSQTNKLLIAKVGTDTIIASNVDGTNPITVYNNTTRVQDPYAIAVDSEGYVYVGSSVQDSIEKFSFNGTTLTPVQGGPWISTGIYVLNPTALAVMP